MSTSEDAAMMESGKKASHFWLVSHSKKNKTAKDGVAAEGEIQHTFIYLMWILINANDPSTKKAYMTMYNPIPKTKILLITVADLDPGLTLTSLNGKTKLRLSKDTFPKTKDTFKKYSHANGRKQALNRKNKYVLDAL